jgi:glucosylceramidase
VFSKPCAARSVPGGLICVCNSTYCDTLEYSPPTKIGDVLIFSTSKNGLRFYQTDTKFLTNYTLDDFKYKGNKITVDRSKSYQKIIGFGSHITGTVQANLKRMSPELRNQLYMSFYSKTLGNAYTMLRTSIGGSDNDLEPWTYAEYPEYDANLTTFTKLDPRDELKISQINELVKITGNNDIKLIGATWSPPRWMKTNKEWTGEAYLRKEYYSTWALYHVRFLELMKKAGIDFWAISTANEPQNGTFLGQFIYRWMSIGWDPTSMARWVANFLGPMLRKKFPMVNIITGDDQRFTFPSWFDTMYSSYPDSRQYIFGHATHWYLNWAAKPKVLTETYLKYPEINIMATEAATGTKPWEVSGPLLGDWTRAERYIIDIMETFDNYCTVWMDWNLIVNRTGGPAYDPGTFSDAATILPDDGKNFINFS